MFGIQTLAHGCKSVKGRPGPTIEAVCIAEMAEIRVLAPAGLKDVTGRESSQNKSRKLGLAGAS